jgi:transcriptional regulator with XRE-family HTH domain
MQSNLRKSLAAINMLKTQINEGVMKTPLRMLRLEQKKTIQDVAKATNIDVGNLSRIERGMQVTSLEIAEKLSKYFGGEISEMQILFPQRFLASDDAIGSERNS